MSIREVLVNAKQELAKFDVPAVDAELMLAHVLGVNRMDLHGP